MGGGRELDICANTTKKNGALGKQGRKDERQPPGGMQLWSAKSFSSHAQPVACSTGRSDRSVETAEHDGMQTV